MQMAVTDAGTTRVVEIGKAGAGVAPPSARWAAAVTTSSTAMLVVPGWFFGLWVRAGARSIATANKTWRGAVVALVYMAAAPGFRRDSARLYHKKETPRSGGRFRCIILTVLQEKTWIGRWIRSAILS
ncbi:hypothetical protein BDA96_06G163700 [Sorghum bicolor]|uniref:Uncharacterized protein n=1 Tax=Sorghum bicolor TaxID=4558 RepID=A0A921UCN3_SORBI|nr:hypothetical protein BDA96_06G163700 [Sorghum bicolor]